MDSTMTSLQALSSCALFLLLVLPDAGMASSTMLRDNCDLYASGDQSSYDYCVKTLQADRASATAADARGLAVVAARIARATAKATSAKIAQRQGAETMPARRDCLASCAKEFYAAVRRLGRAARSAAAGHLGRAQNLLAEVTGAPARCEGAFAAAGQYSPLAAADRELDDQVELAIGLLPPPSLRTTGA